MGQQKNTQLKAYVRFDGTGRIVPSSLILQRFKPKDGNWQEIDATECCGYVPTPSTTTTTSSSTSTTTSTSTSSTTTTTTTQGPVLSFIGTGGNSTVTSCSPGGTSTYYTTGPLAGGIYPQNGITVYYDEALTQPVTLSYMGSPGLGTILDCNNGVLSNERPCV